MDDFNISNGGKDLIADATMMLAFGRRYGLIGRNGTGKTTLLRALAGHEVKGIPKNCQVWKVIVWHDMRPRGCLLTALCGEVWMPSVGRCGQKSKQLNVEAMTAVGTVWHLYM